MVSKTSARSTLVLVCFLLAFQLAIAAAIKLFNVSTASPPVEPHPAVATYLTWVSAYIADGQSDADIETLEATVARAFDIVLRDHIGEPSEQSLIQGATTGVEALNPAFGGHATDELAVASIRGMLATLDPHTGYLPPEEMSRYRESGRGTFEGLGIELTRDGDFLKILTPMDDTPASRAGLLPGDLISHIDGRDARHLAVSDAVALLRGETGSDVTVRIMRGGRPPFDVTVTRDIIRLHPVRHRLIDDVGYVRVAMLSERSVSDVESAIDAILSQSGGRLSGVILDLRRNPGGVVDTGLALSDLLLDDLSVGSLRRRRPEDDRKYRAGPGDRLDGRRLAVLVDAGTTGAAEWVVGALQDHRRAVVVGTFTAGHGTTGQLYALDLGGGLRVTDTRYETPLGRRFDGIGIGPDVEIGPSTSAVFGYGEFARDQCLRAHPDGGGDDALSCALAVLRSGDIGRFYDRMRD